MASFQNYIFPESLEDAYKLLQANRRNAVIGGNGWLALGRQKLHTAIDLSRLGLDQIRVGPAYVEIGAMATLRQLERELPGSLLACCVKPIAGVQFRNLATVGGSLYSRFGFSDPITALMAMDTTVILHRQGDVPIADFVWQKPSRDIVLGCRIENNGRRAAYQSLRLSATDLPALTVAVSRLDRAGIRLARCGWGAARKSHAGRGSIPPPFRGESGRRYRGFHGGGGTFLWLEHAGQRRLPAADRSGPDRAGN